MVRGDGQVERFGPGAGVVRHADAGRRQCDLGRVGIAHPAAVYEIQGDHRIRPELLRQADVGLDVDPVRDEVFGQRGPGELHRLLLEGARGDGRRQAIRVDRNEIQGAGFVDDRTGIGQPVDPVGAVIDRALAGCGLDFETALEGRAVIRENRQLGKDDMDAIRALQRRAAARPEGHVPGAIGGKRQHLIVRQGAFAGLRNRFRQGAGLHRLGQPPGRIGNRCVGRGYRDGDLQARTIVAAVLVHREADRRRRRILVHKGQEEVENGLFVDDSAMAHLPEAEFEHLVGVGADAAARIRVLHVAKIVACDDGHVADLAVIQRRGGPPCVDRRALRR